MSLPKEKKFSQSTVTALMPADERCPLCGFMNRPSADNFRRCGSCRAIYFAGYKPLGYNDGYFTDEYRVQYGKTYFEDYPAISALADRRLDVIFKLINKKGGGIRNRELSLLDIGAAAGFFLKRAGERGIRVLKGIEISEFAAGYGIENFGLDIQVSSFEKSEMPRDIDIVTAWYFIEHLENPGTAVKQIADLLEVGGIFAFSAPSVFGPLYFFNRKQWKETHPSDHRVDFTPYTAVKVLKAAGFRYVYVRAAGIHPERVWRRDSLGYRLFSGLYRAFSGLTGFSDTIEVYALK